MMTKPRIDSSIANRTDQNRTDQNRTEQKSRQPQSRANMTSNATKALLVAGSLWVTVMGSQALAWEQASQGENQSASQSAIGSQPSASLAVYAAVPGTDLGVVPTILDRRVELIVEPFHYTIPETRSVTMDVQAVEVDLSAFSASLIDSQVPAPALPMPAEIQLNLAPIPKAIVPPPVNVSVQSVASSKSSR